MNIIVYTKTGCPWCIGMIDFLKQNNVEFEERNVTENPKYFEEMIQKSGQPKAPTLDIDGEIFADQSAEEIEPVLKNKKII